jgi:hypothetical protein
VNPGATDWAGALVGSGEKMGGGSGAGGALVTGERLKASEPRNRARVASEKRTMSASTFAKA